MPYKFILSLLIGGLLSAVTLYLAFRNVPLSDLIAYLKTIRYAWLGPSVALVVVVSVLRTYRWQLIVRSVYRLSFWQAFHPLMLGFMINCVLPGRVGELARPVLLKKNHDVAFSSGLATVAAERVFDMVVLIALFAAIFSTIESRPDLAVSFAGWELDSRTLKSAAWAMIRLSIVLAGGLSLLAFSTPRRWLVHLIEWFARFSGRAGQGFQKRVRRIGLFVTGWLEGFAEGLKMVADLRRTLVCMALTITIWALTLLSLYVFSFGCPGINLSIAQMAVVLVIICFFIALPSAPGFWGLWEAGGIFALSLFAISPKDAAGFTLVTHAVQIFPIILIGWVSALVTSANIWQLTFKNSKEIALSEHV